jgi:hypothetical protein
MNDYGVYALVGSTTSKISDQLDGIFPYIDFTQPVSAGQVLLNNILCAAFNFTYTAPGAQPRQLQAIFFEKKWFLTSQGAQTLVTSVPVMPIEMPMSAILSAGASLTPSPVIATTCCFDFQL